MPKRTISSPPKLRLPKSLGLCADKYRDVREQRLEADKLAAEFKAQETEIQEHIIKNLSKSADEGAVGRRFVAKVTRDQKPQIEDASKFNAYIKKHGAFDLLQRRLNEKAVADRMEANKGKPLPGLKMFTVVKLSVTKK